MTALLALLLFAQQSKLPEGKGKRELLRACGTCHPSEVVLDNHNSKQGWTELVDEMISKGAVANARDRERIIAYLARYFALRLN